MDEHFPQYYPISDDECKALWDRALIIPDTNVLLSLYVTGKKGRSELIAALEQVKDRLWIPNWVACEYEAKRPQFEKRTDPLRYGHDQVVAALTHIRERAVQEREHKSSEAADILESWSRRLEHLEEEVRKERETKATELGQEEVRQRLTQLLAGRIGAPYKTEQLEDILRRGNLRLEWGMPPGSKDARKMTQDMHRKKDALGDFFIWCQIIDHAKDAQCPAILITDDVKDDWWLTDNRMGVGPRTELVAEFCAAVNEPFFIQRPDQFKEIVHRFYETDSTVEGTTDIIKGARDTSTMLLTSFRFDAPPASDSPLSSPLPNHIPAAGWLGNSNTFFGSPHPSDRTSPFDLTASGEDPRERVQGSDDDDEGEELTS